MKWTRRTVIAAAAGGAVLVPAPALAHIDPDPVEAQAGSVQSVGFTVEHGCDGSPTVQLDMRLPTGTSQVTPEPPEGWTASIDGDVVTFRGGPLADDVELTFRVGMVLPPTPDTDIYFPFVQRCETGEIRWIDIPTDGAASELDEPAPAMRLTGPVAAPLVTAPPATILPATTATTAATIPTATPAPTHEAVTTTQAPPTTATTAAAPSTTGAATAGSDLAVAETDDGDDASGTIGVVAGAAVVAVAGGLAAWRAWSRRR